MSKYVTYSISAMRNLEVLLATLADLGWDAGKVEVHETPQALYGYTGDRRAEKANVIIRRNNTGVGSSNDIGFIKDPDGTYRPVISEYDNGACRGGYSRNHADAGSSLSETLERVYGRVAGDKAISTILTKTLPRMKAQGLVPRHATAKTVTAGNARKIVVSY